MSALSRPARFMRVAGVAATIGTAVLASGCGGSSASPTTAAASKASEDFARLVRFSSCMRAHGVPGFPDPVRQGGGGVGLQIKQSSGVNPRSPAFGVAQGTCRHVLPGGGISRPLSSTQRQRFLDYAACIRTHGVPDFPDPTFGNGGVEIRIGGPGADQNSPAFKTALRSCRSLLPSLKFGGP